MTLTDIISKIILYAKRAIVNDNSSNTTAEINQTGSGVGLSVKSVTGTSIVVENTNPAAGKGGKLEVFHPTNGDFVFDGGSDGLFVFVNTSPTGTTGFNSSKTVFSGGNVGIGTSNPIKKLEVEGTIRAGRNDTSQEGGEVEISRAIDNAVAWSIDVNGATLNPSFRIIDRTISTERFIINQNGNVGIGTSAPTSKLHVNGNTQLDGDIYVNGNTHLDGTVRMDVATTTTVGGAGGASALPATPTGYLVINLSGINYKVPYYNMT